MKSSRASGHIYRWEAMTGASVNLRRVCAGVRLSAGPVTGGGSASVFVASESARKVALSRFGAGKCYRLVTMARRKLR